MNKKTKIGLVLSSAAAILLAGSIMAGGTYALFTSESTNNIVVNSGKVEVSAAIGDFTTYSGKADSLVGDPDIDEENIKSSTDLGITEHTFLNGGSATLESGTGTLKLSNITPGDRVKFDVKLTNNTNVKAKYRVVVSCDEDNDLFDGLKITVDETTIENGFSLVTDYEDLEPVTTATELETPISITVDFPSDRNNDYMNKDCTIQVSVEAIQGNALTSWDEEALHLYNERDLRKFAKAVNEGLDVISDYETFELTSDVELTDGEWTPIGQKEGNKFTSTFDGGNHTISNMNVTATTVGRDGAFCEANAESGAVTTKNNFDGFGAFFGAIEGDAKIMNLTVKGSVECDNAGGIVARSNAGAIENCNSYINVSGIRKAGGIVCATNAGITTIKNCNNYGDVDSVVGNNCFNTEDHTTHSGTEKASAGGIIGFANTTQYCEISNCMNKGNIGSENCDYSGGIIAYMTGAEAKVTEAKNSGVISGKVDSAGIIGLVLQNKKATIKDCTNEGTISGTGITAKICVLNGTVDVTYIVGETTTTHTSGKID